MAMSRESNNPANVPAQERADGWYFVRTEGSPDNDWIAARWYGKNIFMWLYAAPNGHSGWFEHVAEIGPRIPMPDEAPTSEQAQSLVCVRCGGTAEFQRSEGLYRHKGEPHEPEYLAQGFCDRYGYPIEVQSAAPKPNNDSNLLANTGIESATPTSEQAARPAVHPQILTGGNHLATLLIGWGLPIEDQNAFYEDVLQKRGAQYADVWACWSAIMRCRDSADLAAPHPDTVRLDWLEGQRPCSLQMWVGQTAIHKPGDLFVVNEYGKTVREIIDAALAQHPPEGPR